MEIMVGHQLATESANEYAYRILRENILQAKLLPGQCISPVEVSDLLGISRTPIQGAFSRLMSEGLLNVYPQRGSYVSLIDMKRVGESVLMRSLTDQTVVRQLCTLGISDEGLMELQTNLYQQNFSFHKGLTEEVFALDNRFHSMMYQICEMQNIYQALRSISSDECRVRLLKLKARIRWEETANEHEGILRAIRDRKAQEGQRLSFEHISRISWDLESVHHAYPDYFEHWDMHTQLSLHYRADSYYTMDNREEKG